jgi:hypothetical protein
MLTTGTQNLPEPLAQVQAAYHGTARLAPASAQVLRGVMALVGWDFGNIQIVDPATGSLTPHREIAAATGFRAVQSTPLVDYAGHSFARLDARQGPARPARQARLRGRSP